MSQTTLYKSRSNFAGMDISLIKHLKELETAHVRLKRVYDEDHLKLELGGEALEKKSYYVSTRRVIAKQLKV